MTKTTLQMRPVPTAHHLNKRPYSQCSTDTNDAERQQPSPTTSPTGQKTKAHDATRNPGLQGRSPEVSEAPSDIIVKGLIIYVMAQNETLVDLNKRIFVKERVYCAQAASCCDYFKRRPAIRLFLSDVITSRALEERLYTNKSAEEAIKQTNIHSHIEAILSRPRDVGRMEFKEQDLMICIKTQFSDTPTLIQYIQSPKVRTRLDHYFGEATHLILRAIALHQSPDRHASETKTGEELGLLIDGVDRALSVPYLEKAKRRGLHPNKLLEFVEQFPCLSKRYRYSCYATMHLWKGQPDIALSLLDAIRTSLSGGTCHIEIRANYEAGKVDKARELRLKCPNLGILRSAVYDFFELTRQESNLKQDAMESLARTFSDPKTLEEVEMGYYFYALHGCFLYHQAIAAGEAVSTELMTQSIRSWEQALETTGAKARLSMSRFIARLTVCALSFKCQLEDADDKFQDFNLVEQQNIIYYDAYINKEWLDTMYTILGEYGKHDYVEKRPKRIES